MNQELYFLRSSEQYLAKELLPLAFDVEESNESIEQYERHFGSYNGDVGVYMMFNNKVAGAAWVRVLANGFAFVDHDTPELIVVVKPEYRKQGLATALMNQLFIEVSKIFSQLSVSVEDNSPTQKFFEKLGFTKIDNSEHKNEKGSDAFKMLKVLKEIEASKEEKHLEEECFRKSFRA